MRTPSPLETDQDELIHHIHDDIADLPLGEDDSLLLPHMIPLPQESRKRANPLDESAQSLMSDAPIPKQSHTRASKRTRDADNSTMSHASVEPTSKRGHLDDSPLDITPPERVEQPVSSMPRCDKFVDRLAA